MRITETVMRGFAKIVKFWLDFRGRLICEIGLYAGKYGKCQMFPNLLFHFLTTVYVMLGHFHQCLLFMGFVDERGFGDLL